jgi:5-hydroxyisourate hydrolase
MAEETNRISTHVLDTARGIPAEGMVVRLEQRKSGGSWQAIGTSQTDGDGRCKQLLSEPHALPPGVYRIGFQTGDYFAAQDIPGLYPVVEITFEVRSGQTHFHIPLLLSPNGYTTYRGS